MTATTIKRATVTLTRIYGDPRPRLDALGYTVQGGSPTRRQVQIDGEVTKSGKPVWRRVYCLQFSNAPSFVVKVNGQSVFI